MENAFIGYRINGTLFGCKEYLSNEKIEADIHEMITTFYRNNSLQEMKQLLERISWKKVGEYIRENNGYFFSLLLRENSIEEYGYLHKTLNEKMNRKKKGSGPRYNPMYFEEIDGEMYATFKNYAEVLDEFTLDKIYILDLQRDVLIIEDRRSGETKELSKNDTYGIHTKDV